MKLIAVTALSIAALNLGACATVINGTHQSYMTKTTPEGAAVKYSSGQSCTSPCNLEHRRKDDMRIDISLPGYKPTYVLVRSKLGGTAFGNIIGGGIVGGVVDGANGASNKLVPNSPLFVRLAPEGSPDGAVILDKKGALVTSVKEWNDRVRADVSKTVGPRLAGLEGNDPQ